MAAELSVKVENAEGCPCTLGVGRFRRRWLSLPSSVPLCALSTVHEKGGQGRWDNGEVLPSEQPPESISAGLRFLPLVPLPELFIVFLCL